MAIGAVQSQYQYQNPYLFGTNVKPQNQQIQGYNQGVPNTTPQVVGFGIPTSEDMEMATKIAESNIGAVNPFVVNKNKGNEYFPTGDGEVHPVYGEDEHKLEFFC